jgi:4-amino-4-deoxy-L-arabinose transferase-like glycosyltransferase
MVTLLVGAMFHGLLAFVIFAEMPQTEDGPSYRAQALNILDGRQSYYFFPPGTALAAVPLYAVFGDSLTTDHLVATIFWIAFSIACAWLAWLMCDSKKTAWIATLFAAMLPHGLLATGTISSQPLTAALLASSICLGILSYRKGSLTLWTAAAALLAFAVLVRPATLAVSSTVMLLLIWAAWKHHISVARGVSSGTLLVVVHAMFLLPVMNHNASQGQGYSVSTNNEWNLLVGNNPYTPNYKTGHFGQRTFDKIDVDARAYLSAFLPHQQPANATFSERQQMRSEAIEYIVDHPLQFLYRVSNRFRGFWGMDYTASRELQNAYGLGITQTGVLLLLEGGGFIFVLLLSLLYYVRTGLDTRNTLTYIFLAASIAPYLLAFSVAKYHTVVLPVLFPLAAQAIVWITSKEERQMMLAHRPKRLLIMLLIVAVIQMEHVYHIVDNR